MKASISGRVRNTTLPKAKGLFPLFEAVMNSFQAIEEVGGLGHAISIRAERDAFLPEDQLAPITGFSITDTGIGFTDTNYESFQTVDSPHKITHGGKGLGRFLWLKAFQNVEIDSHYRMNDGAALMHRQFQFRITEDDQPSAPTLSGSRHLQTSVKLIGLTAPYIDAIPRDLDALAQQIVAHFLPFFLDPSGPALTLADAFHNVDLRSFFRQHFEAFASGRSFKIGENLFTLRGFRLRGSLADHHKIVYAAHFREVISERLAKYIPNLKSKIIDCELGDFYYLGLVQGHLLDTRVNNERTDFAISREAPDPNPGSDNDGFVTVASDLFSNELSMRAIRDAATTAVSQDLQPFLDAINSQKESALSSFIEQDQPQYRALMKYKAEFIDEIPPQATKAELDTALHRQIYQRQVKLKAEGKKILAEADHVENVEEYYKRFQKFVETENELGKTALAQYVVHRRVILELLQKALGRDPGTGEYALEKTIHQLIFPMRATSDEVPFEQQNLWIIDERLTFHSFLASDKPLSQLNVVDSASDSRPDLLIFDRPLAFSDEGVPLQSMVIVEFKKPDRSNYRDEDPVTQVYRMVREVRSDRAQDKNGRYIRTASSSVPAYCYIICDLTPSLEVRVQNMGARKTPDSLGYYGYNETLNAYYEVISYTKLLDDAKKRNRILFEKLNVPLVNTQP